MATSKDQPKSSTEPKKTETDEKPKASPARKADKPYAEQAATLADDARALAEGMREDLDKFADRVRELNATPDLDVTDVPTADGVRRIPTAIDEVHRALQAFTLAAADLSREAGR